jgi:Tol biopolymer transport system component
MVFGDEPASPVATVQFEIEPPVRLADSGNFSVSPDGRHLVFAGTGEDGVLRLWLRALDSLETTPVSGTEGELAVNTPPMIWSPDGRFIAFFAGGRIKKIERSGGAIQTICELPPGLVAVGGSWNRDDVVVLGSNAGGLLRCPASGGAPAPVTSLEPSERSVNHLLPWFLPDGRHIVYLSVSRSNPAESGLHIADLAAAPDAQPRERLLASGFGATYTSDTADSGHLLHVREGTLWASPFDTRRRRITGDPVRVAGPVGAFRDGAFFSATPAVLVYRSGIPEYELVWRDRAGMRRGSVADVGPYAGLSLSPDGARAVLIRENQLNRSDRDLWLVDLTRNTSTRLTFGPLMESRPAWLPDASSILYSLAPGAGDVYRKDVSGTSPEEVVIPASASAALTINPAFVDLSVTPDGRFVVATAATDSRTKNDLWLLPMQGGQAALPLVRWEGDQTGGRLSPDGRWLAYLSNESGGDEVFVREVTRGGAADYPKAGRAIQVSRGGAAGPRWSANSRELFYLSAPGAVMTVPVTLSGPGAPVELFRAPGALNEWGVAPAGDRFLLLTPVARTTQPPFTVVLHWRSLLRTLQ